MSPKLSGWLTRRQVAQQFGFSPYQTEQLIAQGVLVPQQLPGLKRPCFKAEEVAAVKDRLDQEMDAAEAKRLEAIEKAPSCISSKALRKNYLK